MLLVPDPVPPGQVLTPSNEWSTQQADRREMRLLEVGNTPTCLRWVARLQGLVANALCRWTNTPLLARLVTHIPSIQHGAGNEGYPIQEGKILAHKTGECKPVSRDLCAVAFINHMNRSFVMVLAKFRRQCGSPPEPPVDDAAFRPRSHQRVAALVGTGRGGRTHTVFDEQESARGVVTAVPSGQNTQPTCKRCELRHRWHLPACRSRPNSIAAPRRTGDTTRTTRRPNRAASTGSVSGHCGRGVGGGEAGYYFRDDERHHAKSNRLFHHCFLRVSEDRQDGLKRNDLR